MTVRAVTFDFWNTLFVPAALGMQPRLPALLALIAEVRPDLAPERAEQLVRSAAAENDAAWRRGEHFGSSGMVRALFDELGVDLAPAFADRFLEAIEDPPGDPIQPVPGAIEAVRGLRAQGLLLGIVSDTGYRPGRVLRRIIDDHGLLDCFEAGALAFSDEVGVPKPSPRIFLRALEALGTEPEAAVHVGDLRFTDIAGARGLGMGTVRVAITNDDQEEGPEADAVIRAYTELAGTIAGW